jgi:hypothetical protein
MDPYPVLQSEEADESSTSLMEIFDDAPQTTPNFGPHNAAAAASKRPFDTLTEEPGPAFWELEAHERQGARRG